jgi:hypothetical protein
LLRSQERDSDIRPLLARVALGCRSNQNFHNVPTRSRGFVVRNWITNWRARRARAPNEAVWRAELDRLGV